MSVATTLDGLNALYQAGPRPGSPILLCLHGFGDHGGMFEPLFTTTLAGRFALVAPDLPGCGHSPADPTARTIQGLAERLERLTGHLDDDAGIALVGHSIGSAIAVETARRLAGRCLGLFSIEGNLTAKDAYFSGQANKWEDPDKFKAHLVKGTRNMAHFKPELTRYAEVLERADAPSLWHLGRDAYRCGRDDALGERYRALTCPTLYYWCETTTPVATREYIRTHRIAAREYAEAGHWPTIDTPAACAEAISAFFDGLAE